MKIVILCSDGPHNKYLISKVCKSFDKVNIFVESGKKQLAWKYKKKQYRQYLQLRYQIMRRTICGSNRYRKKFFEVYIPEFRFEDYNVQFIDNINDEKVVMGIQKCKPDIVIVMGTSILQKKFCKL